MQVLRSLALYGEYEVLAPTNLRWRCGHYVVVKKQRVEQVVGKVE